MSGNEERRARGDPRTCHKDLPKAEVWQGAECADAVAQGDDDTMANPEVDSVGQNDVGTLAPLADVPDEDTLSRRPVRTWRIRTAVLSAAALITCGGALVGSGWGTISSFGWEQIAVICPLGGLEAILASKTVVPRALAVLAVIVAFCVVFGRAFCSWVCPVPLLKRIGRAVSGKRAHIVLPRGKYARKTDGKRAPHVTAPLSRRERRMLERGCSDTGHAYARRGEGSIDSRHLVLGGALVSAAVFGFPVFCLICPIGLLFGTVIAVGQLFGLQTLSWGLLVFPLALTLELTVARRWCSRFCPIGALLSLASIPNRMFRPKVNATRCLRCHGVPCTVCTDLCAEGLDPHSDALMRECTKCGDCAANCPAHAISFPVKPM